MLLLGLTLVVTVAVITNTEILKAICSCVHNGERQCMYTQELHLGWSISGGARLLGGTRAQSKQTTHDAPEFEDDRVCGIEYAMKSPVP